MFAILLFFLKDNGIQLTMTFRLFFSEIKRRKFLKNNTTAKPDQQRTLGIELPHSAYITHIVMCIYCSHHVRRNFECIHTIAFFAPLPAPPSNIT